MLKHLISDESTRHSDSLLEEVSGSLGLKKSSVRKAFVRGSREALELINGRDLTGETWMSIMIDGIEFASRCVIGVLGVTGGN